MLASIMRDWVGPRCGLGFTFILETSCRPVSRGQDHRRSQSTEQLVKNQGWQGRKSLHLAVDELNWLILMPARV